MAKIVSNTESLHLTGLGITVEVPEDYYYVAVDDDGVCCTFEDEPEYDKKHECWVEGRHSFIRSFVSICCVKFESKKEKELCKHKFWKVGE